MPYVIDLGFSNGSQLGIPYMWAGGFSYHGRTTCPCLASCLRFAPAIGHVLLVLLCHHNNIIIMALLAVYIPPGLWCEGTVLACHCTYL